MKRKPHLLYLVTEDWYFCSHRLDLAIAARDAGYRVTVATRVRADGDRIRAAGVELVPLRMSRSSKNPLRELAAVAEIIQIYRRLRPDIVHHVAVKPVLYGSIAARIAGVPQVVNALMGLGYVFSSSELKARLLQPFIRLAYRSFLDRPNARLIVQNSDDQAFFVGNDLVSPERISLIRGSGVDLSRYQPTPEPPGIPLIVLPARMLCDKGVQEFVAASRLLKAQGVNSRFALVGIPDPENPTSIPESQLNAWAAEGVVEYWGGQADMANVYRQAHVVCLPSYREGLPKALLEAAACGRPVVTTDVPGCREAVTEGVNGLLVPPRDSVVLATALERLVSDPVLRESMGKRGSQRAQLEFALDKVLAETLSLYR